MSILTSKLPTSLIIGGEHYEINTDFRVGIQFENLLNDKELTDEEILNKAIELYYPIIPQDLEEAISQMLWFYRCGKEIEEPKGQSKQAKDIYSFEYDADSIYSGFLDQYGIDLQEVECLHWWKFKALFAALKEDTDISKKMSIRAMDLNSLSKEQREYYSKMKKIYAIPRDKDEVNSQSRLDEILMNGGTLSELEE